MKIYTKYTGIAAIILLSLLFASCLQETVGPLSKSTTRIQVNVSSQLNGNHAPLADAMLNKSTVHAKKIAGILGDTLAVDEVKIVLLDMTKYNSWQDFQNTWETTGQYSLMDTTIYYQMEREGKDWFDIYKTMFKSYTGTEYKYIGDYAFSLKGGQSEATFYLNPGLNYFYYAFRSSAKDSSLYLSEGHLNVKENVDNTIQLGKMDVTGSYSGVWKNFSGDSTGAVSLNIYQTTTDSIKGTLTMEGFSCYRTFSVAGMVGYSNYISINIVDSQYAGYFYMSQDGYDFSGTWYILPSCRSFYQGNIAIQRTSTTPNLGKVQ